MTSILAALALAGLTVPAVAAHAPDQQTMPVSVSDLDLSSMDGQRILARRIHRAAQALCASHVVDGLPQALRSQRRCIRATKTRAMAAARTHHAALAALPERVPQPGSLPAQ